VGYDIVYGSSLNLVIERQNVARALLRDVSVQLLALLGRQADGIARVEVPHGDLLPVLCCDPTDAVVELAVRWAHERGDHTYDPVQRQVEERELAVNLLRAQRREVLVRPGMRSHLMSLAVRVLDASDVLG